MGLVFAPSVGDQWRGVFLPSIDGAATAVRIDRCSWQLR